MLNEENFYKGLEEIMRNSLKIESSRDEPGSITPLKEATMNITVLLTSLSIMRVAGHVSERGLEVIKDLCIETLDLLKQVDE